MNLGRLTEAIRSGSSLSAHGAIVSVRGSTLSARLPTAAIGDLCHVSSAQGSIASRVIGFSEGSVTLAPFEEPVGVRIGSLVVNSCRPPSVSIATDPRGMVLDALGRHAHLSLLPASFGDRIEIDIASTAPPPFERTRVSRRIMTGVNVIDAACGIGRGQRMGIFAPAGTGKSTLLGMLARHSSADVNVVALVGERGREVREVIEDVLGPEGMSRSVVIVSTSDESATRRVLAAYTATAIAEHFRSLGLDVLLLVDSLTRVARALREIGLSAGELPTRSGYPPSVFGELPRLLERAGNADRGSITAFYTVLTNDDAPDPIDEEIKSILDGHLTLSRELALKNLRPAIDLTRSISRVAHMLESEEHSSAVATVVSLLHRLGRDRDVLIFGGSPDPELAAALDLEGPIIELFRQPIESRPAFENTRESLLAIALEARRKIAAGRLAAAA